MNRFQQTDKIQKQIQIQIQIIIIELMRQLRF